MPEWLFSIGAPLLLATTASGTVASETVVDHAAPETPPDAEIIDMERERYRRLTVPVSIQGQGPFQFMIDTGAQATVLSHELAEQLALYDRKPATLVGMASSKPIETVMVEDFTIGSRNLTIRTAPLVPRANIGSAYGILGLDSLQDQRVLLDFTENTIAVADADELGGNSGYEIVVRAKRKLGQLIIARARIDGIRVAVIVDTGAQGSVGNLALQEKLRSASMGVVQMTDVNGHQMDGDVKIGKNLEIGRVQLSSFPIVFAESPPFEALGLHDEPALILGLSELKLFRRVAIDFKSNRILFDVPRDVSREMRRQNFRNM